MKKKIFIFLLIFLFTFNFSFFRHKIVVYPITAEIVLLEGSEFVGGSVLSGGAIAGLTVPLATALLIGGGLYGGYKIISNRDKIYQMLVDKVLSFSSDQLNSYYSVSSDNSINLTPSGIKYASSEIQKIKNYCPDVISSDVYYTGSNATYKCTTYDVSGATDYDVVYRRSFDSPFHVCYGVNGVQYETLMNGGTISATIFDGNIYVGRGSSLSSALNDCIPLTSNEFVIGFEDTSLYYPYADSIGISSPLDIPSNGITIPQQRVENLPLSIPNTGVVDVPVADIPVADSIPYDITDFIDVSIDTPIDTPFNPSLEIPEGDVPELDFTPLQIVTRKFPFSIPFDLYNSISILSTDSKYFAYTFDTLEFSVLGNNFKLFDSFTIKYDDKSYFYIIVLFIRYFLLLQFVIFIIIKTRSLIRG